MNTLDIMPLVESYLKIDGNQCGGSLHIFLDDGNFEDKHIQACIDWAKQKNDIAGVDLAVNLLSMSKTQRKKIYRKAQCFEL